jgi:hypothetical protein
MLSLDAEPSRKERGHRGVRPRHPNWKAFGSAGAGSSSGPGPRRFSFVCKPEGTSRLRGCPRTASDGGVGG